MILIAAALLMLPQVQDDDRLKTAWPKLVDAWKAAEAFQATPAPDGGDEFLKAAGKLHAAFEAAGLYEMEGGEYVPRAVKAFIKTRFRWLQPSRPGAIRFEATWVGGQPVDPMKAFLDSIGRLKSLEQKGLADEDNVQDELATARKALKAMGVTADETPSSLRRRVLALARALATGEAYPEPARATEEQVKEIRGFMGGLAGDSIEDREKATRELQRFGEAAFPYLREALAGGDAEAASRAKRLLGIDHAPWTALAQQDHRDPKLRFVEEALMKDAERKKAEDAKRK
jgi:hypothetical protein